MRGWWMAGFNMWGVPKVYPETPKKSDNTKQSENMFPNIFLQHKTIRAQIRKQDNPSKSLITVINHPPRNCLSSYRLPLVFLGPVLPRAFFSAGVLLLLLQTPVPGFSEAKEHVGLRSFPDFHLPRHDSLPCNSQETASTVFGIPRTTAYRPLPFRGHDFS